VLLAYKKNSSKARCASPFLLFPSQILPQIKSISIYKGLKNLWSNSLQGREDDEGLTPTKDEGTCLRRLCMFRKEVH